MIEEERWEAYYQGVLSNRTFCRERLSQLHREKAYLADSQARVIRWMKSWPVRVLMLLIPSVRTHFESSLRNSSMGLLGIETSLVVRSLELDQINSSILGLENIGWDNAFRVSEVFKCFYDRTVV